MPERDKDAARSPSEAQETIMKQIAMLQEQIDAMRASMNEQSDARRKQLALKRAPSSTSSSSGNKKSSVTGPDISKRVLNLDDKILECELKDAREGSSLFLR